MCNMHVTDLYEHMGCQIILQLPTHITSNMSFLIVNYDSVNYLKL